MAEQIYIGNASHGQVTSREAWVIDNDAFPQLFNAYVQRGKIKRKRGTKLLAQLRRQIASSAFNLTAGAGNLISQFSLGSTASIADISLTVGGAVFSDPAHDGTLIETVTITGASNAVQCVLTANNLLTGTPNITISNVVGMTQLNGNTYAVVSSTPTTITIAVDSTTFGAYVSGGKGVILSQGTVNYSTGAITIVGGAGNAVTGTFSYFPGLPVMGLRDFVSLTANANFESTQYPFTLAFDTVYSYQINQSGSAPAFYSTSFYKNTGNPVVWSGEDYQQFWTTNYQGALWATNNKPGMHFKLLDRAGISVTQVSATSVTIAITGNGLVLNDVVWINEVTGTIAPAAPVASNQNINGQTGYVSAIGDPNITVTFDGTQGSSLANFQAGATGSAGMAQYLTSSISGQDGIKWYDGDPTNGTGIPVSSGVPSLIQKGWVNFAPPLTALTVSINDKVAGKYYLVGALAIVAFKDRLLFFSPYIETSAGLSSRIQLTDTVIRSWNGTPYYAALTPTSETSSPTAYYVDQTGLGGWLSAGIEQPIATVSNNEDVLLVGFGGRGRKTRFVYTGNDLLPFAFYNINSELPSSATFSSVVLDKGAIDIGQYGIALTDQQSSQRVDLDIPDSVFDIQGLNHGVQRVNAIRDFFREWIYFSYPLNNSKWRFPVRSFLFNYRDNTWAVMYENFTTHGNYRAQTKKTWKTTGFKSWQAWLEPWNTGSDSALFSAVIAGNPQGYVLIKDQGTGEGVSGTILTLANSSGNTQINSIDHCVAVNDYLLFTGALGLTGINGIVGRVISTPNKDAFVVDIPFPSGTYLGMGKYTRLIQPLIQTKMFNPYWDQGRKTRLSAQKYLLDGTPSGQVTVNVYLSQDAKTVWNDPVINVPPNSLVYSQIMFTCQEVDRNVINNASLGGIGNGVLTTLNLNISAPIVKSSILITVGTVATFTDDGLGGFTVTGTGVALGSSVDYVTGEVVLVFSVAPNKIVTHITYTFLSGNLQMPTAETQTQIWHRFNTSMIGDSVQIGITLSNDTPGQQDAQMRNVVYATSEIALHGIHLTVEKSSQLA